jgi:deoxyribodipyrimidine photolyase
MDIQVDFFRWQVPDLKEYLQDRGITCHLYRKHELVKLCELAQELDLEKITSTNDYELSQVNRRTITENGNLPSEKIYLNIHDNNDKRNLLINADKPEV